MNITRRGFLGGLMAVAGAVVVERTFPFRTYSFPEQIRPLNHPGSLWKIGDKFTTDVGVIYEVTGILVSGPSNQLKPPIYSDFEAVRGYSRTAYAPQTVMTEQEFSLITRPTEKKYIESTGKELNYNYLTHTYTKERPQGDGYYGKRVFTLERNGQQSRIYTRSYLANEKI